jgi:hypothetical protein
MLTTMETISRPEQGRDCYKLFTVFTAVHNFSGPSVTIEAVKGGSVANQVVANS